MQKEGEKISFWVETDVEPDDVQALMFLPDFGYIHTIVAGGSTEPKKVVESAMRFMTCMKIPHLPKRYITGVADNYVFKERGLEHVIVGPGYPVLVENVITSKEYAQNFEDWVSWCDKEKMRPVFVSLKPSHEMYAAFHLISSETTKKVSCISHMGFNSREVLKSPDVDRVRFKVMFERFKDVRIFARGSIKGDTSVRGSVDWTVFEVINGPDVNVVNGGPFVNAHNSLMRLWNTHVNDECNKKIDEMLVQGINDIRFREMDQGTRVKFEEINAVLKNPDDVEEFKAIHALYKKTRERHNQFLLADQCVVIAAFSSVIEKECMFRSSLQFDKKGNFVVNSTGDSDSNIYTYEDIPRSIFIFAIQKKFEQFVLNKI